MISQKRIRVGSLLLILILMSLGVLAQSITRSGKSMLPKPIAQSFQSVYKFDHYIFEVVNIPTEERYMTLGPEGIFVNGHADSSIDILIKAKNNSYDFGRNIELSPKNQKIEIYVINDRGIFYFLDEKLYYSHRANKELFQSFSPRSIFVQPYLELKEVQSHIARTVPEIDLVIILIMGIAFFTFFSLAINLHQPKDVLKNQDIVGLTRFSVIPMLCFLGLSIFQVFRFGGFSFDNPYNFLTNLDFLFSDYWQIVQVAHFDRPFDLKATNYPPFTLMFVRLISILSPSLFISAIFATLAFFAYHFFRKFYKPDSFFSLLVILVVPLYMLAFSAARANVDSVVIFMIFLFLLSGERGSRIAPFILSLAIAMKYWPAIFIMYFFRRKQYKNVLITILGTSTLTIFSFFLLGYSRYHEVKSLILQSFFSANIGTQQEYLFNFSMKQPWNLFLNHISSLNVMPLENLNKYSSQAYFAFSIVGCFLLLSWATKTKLLSLELFIYSCIVLLVFSPTYYYRGLVLIVPVLFLKSTKWLGALPKIFPFLIALIVTPQVFFFFSTSVPISALTYPVALILLLIFFYKIESKFPGNPKNTHHK